MAHRAPRADYQESKKYVPSLEVGEYEQYKKKQIKKGGLCSCKPPPDIPDYGVSRSLPPGRGGTVRAPALRPAASPARIQEEREEAEGLRQLRRQPRLRGSRGETEQADGAGQEGLLLHQEPPRPHPAQAEVALLQTTLALPPARLPRQGGLERLTEVHSVPGQILPSFQQLQKDVPTVPERLDVSQQDNVRLPRASPLPPAGGEET